MTIIIILLLYAYVKHLFIKMVDKQGNYGV